MSWRRLVNGFSRVRRFEMQTKRRLTVSVLAICALLALPAAAHAAPPSLFTGHWQGIDVDGSDIRLTIAGPSQGSFLITWTESYISFCGGEAGIIRGTGWLSEDDPNLLEADLHVECFTTGASRDFHVVIEYLPTTNALRITYEDGRFVVLYRSSAQVQNDATIIASAEGEWLWTSDFTPWDVLTISVYESDQAGAALRWTGTKTANQWGFVHVLPTDTGDLDFMLGNYVTVCDSFVEKGLVLESITWDIFDADNDFAAGTAPAGREVMVVVADSPDPEDQYPLWVDADPDGDWTADFSGTVDFPDTPDWRGYSFAQIFDADGDANEAGTPAAGP
jgi:hypothetical protein